MTSPDQPLPDNEPGVRSVSRRGFLGMAGTLLAGVPLLRALPAVAKPASHVIRAELDDASACVLWSLQPVAAEHMLLQAYPVGNGHLGALVSGDPGHDVVDVTVASLWTGGRNNTLQADGQFPYHTDDFGSFTRMAQLLLDLPGHALSQVDTYRRELDLTHGCVRISYRRHGVQHVRELFVSYPDDALVWRLSHAGDDEYAGSLQLLGTHGEVTHDAAAGTRLAGQFANGQRHAVAVSASAEGGRLWSRHGMLHFEHCTALTVVLAAATNYTPNLKQDFMDAAPRPLQMVQSRVRAALEQPFARLRERHVADHRALFDTLQVDLGASLPAQRQLDTWTRLQARAHSGVPDPELEALYLQFGRYLTIAGSRDGLPTNLQGLWLARDDPPWNGDYHTDINLQMNYWLPDRAGLGVCFEALTDFCLAQLEPWTQNTRRWFNDPRNQLRNTSGKLAGWAVAISVNPFGGFGWRWHPPGNAWLCNNLWQHYQYTHNRAYLARVFPLFKGACEFWQARLIETQVTDPATSQKYTVLIDDHDWSPEQGPENARGITYAQELVWDLFGHFVEACRILQRDADYAATIAALRDRLYLPRVSPLTGWLEEWMTPADLGSPTHRHLSPLIGLFPGDRIVPDQSPQALVDGATRLLEARGMHSFGWANAWRALCWDRLKDGEKAYQLLLNNLAPSRGASNGTAMNLFDVYQLGSTGVFQIDANFGMPAAMLDMLLYSRSGRIELLPALPRAWPRGRVSGIGARGGFVVELAWSGGKPTQVVVRSVGGTATTVVHGNQSIPLALQPGESVRFAVTEGLLRMV